MAGVLLASLVLGGCVFPTSTTSCSSFSLSLASNTGGQPTPLAAAVTFRAHDPAAQGYPGTGWHETTRDGGSATLRSGSATLHTVQGSDGTWQVDSGSTC